MMRLQSQGLNSHNTNMSFKPHVGDSTSVTFFGIPHELGDDAANKYISQYGQIVYHFRHKKSYNKHVIFTGRRIYRINLTKPIPKHVYIAGHRCNTMYTNQDQDLAQQQQEEAVEAEKKQREAEEMREGRRIYRMNVTQPIPKHVHIAGHRCSTMYTNQDQERAQQQQEEAVEAEKKRQEAEEMRERAHKI